ncbi:MAG: hypothetical protein IKY44_04040, partial [Clostridia bacterium]|nr:hypothetical protein [Clostridia bacterium]
ADVTTLIYEAQTEYEGSYRDVVTIPDAALLELLLSQKFVNTNGDNVITKGELAGFSGTLNLTNSAVKDITGLRYMTRLTILRIDNTAIADISEMAGMTRLQIFTAANSAVADLAPVAKLENLEFITVPGTKVQSLASLADNRLYSLESINLKGNGITDASALGNIPSLTTITLSENEIDNVSFISSLTAPENLYLDNNYIENIDAIYELSTLVELDVSSNYIDIPKDFKSSMFAANENLVVLRFDNQKRRVLVDILIDVTGSNFFELTIDGYDYGEQDYYHQILDAGQTFTVTASPDMGEFLYWKTDTGKIVSYDAEYTFVAASKTHLTAVFRQSYSNRNYISFYTASKQELSRELRSVTATAEQIESIIPVGPSMTGHVFMGWSVDGVNAIAADVLAETIVYELQFGDVNLTPIYVLLEDLFTVTVVNGTGGGSFVASTIIEVVADEPAEGMKFAYWVDKYGQVVSYNTSYVFVVTSDTTLEAVYVADDEEIETEALIAITDKSSDPDANKVTFVVSRDIPTKYTIVQTGIILTNNAELGTDADAFVIDAEGTIKGTSTSKENVGTYIASKGKVQAGDTWFARGYVVYLDTNGELVYLYSAIDSITA